jgi:protein O-mannosyl-transferase
LQQNLGSARPVRGWLHKTCRRAVPAIVLVGLTIVAYLPVFQCGFVWDDDHYVTENDALRSVEGLGRIWADVGATPQYYPLVFTSYWIEYRLWGLEPAGYHATNLTLHALAVVLIWRVLMVLGLPRPVPWLAAAIFAVHPVHVESVAWITERKNVLSAVFYLAALLAYLRFDGVARSSDAEQRRQRQGAWYAVALVFFLCALLSKTVTASLPAAVLLVIWWKQGRVTVADIVRLAPFFALAVGFGWLTLWVEREHVGATGADWAWSPTERLLIAGRAIWFYVVKLLLPIKLTFVYPRWEVDPRQVWRFLFPLGVLLTLAALWVARRRVGRGPFAAVLFFIGTLVPALGFFNIYPMRYSFVADHFQYLASLGLITLAVATGGELARRHPSRGHAIGIIFAAAILLTFTGLTWQQTRVYRDVETLWQDTLAKNPTAWIAHNNLGVIQLKRGELASAERSFRSVLQFQPGDVRTHNNLGSLSLMRGDFAGAIAHFEAALAGEPDFVGARLNLCKALLAQGRVGDAADHYLHALRVDPDVASVQSKLGLLLLTRADSDVASRFFDRALKLAPTWTMLINERAWMLATATNPSATDVAEALRFARRAAELSDRQDPNVLDTLAAAHAAAGRFDDAIGTAEAALALIEDPKSPLADQIRQRLTCYRSGNPYHDRPASASK